MQHRLVAVWRLPFPRVTPIAWLVVGAWLVVVASAVTGNGGVVHHARLIQGSLPLWVAIVVFLVGWQVMLWAMMVPASLDAIQGQHGSRDKVFFVTGYLAVWTGFGLLAFVSDVGVHAVVNHSPWLAFHPWLIAGGTLVLAGTYQLSNLKAASLAACRVLARGESGETPRQKEVSAGLSYGVRCLGSAWALMLLAFALGAGSVAFMTVITAVMLSEITPWGARTIKITGYCLIALGVIILAGPVEGLPVWAS